jgi:hypothetical protein
MGKKQKNICEKKPEEKKKNWEKNQKKNNTIAIHSNT